MEPMTSQPLVHLTAYDACDDDGCPCETCATPWGTDLPHVLAHGPDAR